jgi:ATP-dependent helicase/nuclease subunit B
VPSRQRALALRLAHTRRQLRSGRSAWASCDVLPWSAWLERIATQGRYGPLQGQRRLGATEEWLLWREAAEGACAGLELLMPEALADALRRSAARARDWGMRWTGATSAESSVLQRADRTFMDRCQQLGAYSVSDWARVLRDFDGAPGPLVFAGFAGLGGALLARLQELGATVWPPTRDAALTPRWQSVGCAEPADELRCAARWCREALARNPQARLLVVDTRLRLRRAQAVQAFEHELHGSELLGRVGEMLYGIEGGQPLADYALVRAALDVLQLSGGTLEFPQLAALLRSPYIGCGTLSQRAALELALREHNVPEADFARVCQLAGAQQSGEGSTLSDTLRGIAHSWAGDTRRSDHAAGWARDFAARLEAGGWPGEQALGSEELQQCERLRDLLGELSTLGGSGRLLSFGQALDLLRALARRTSFEAATPDVPVTLTESTDDPLIDYDGIWVAGLSAESWPAPPRADPFAPIGAQRTAGYPPASAHGQLEAARRAMRAWQRCTSQLVMSWPWADGDVPMQPSQLLGVAPRAHGAQVASASADRLLAALRENARREARPAERALAWPVGQRLKGGTRVLQLQALCPFKAVAELRLGALRVPEPRPGLDRLARGQVLHRALELVFVQLKDSRELRRRAANPPALLALVREACDRAVRERLALGMERVPDALLDNEKIRLTTLITELLREELRRAESVEFTIAALEEAQDLELAGFPIRVRMDRLDRLDDGRLIVLDYKSGAPQPFRPLDERPRQAQLLAYAVLTRASVAAVAAVHLGARDIRWRGAAAEPSLLPGLGRPRAPTAPWPELLVHWRRVVENLARDYVAGASAVDPLPGACLLCQLPALCRVDARRRNEPEPDSVDAGVNESDTDGL